MPENKPAYPHPEAKPVGGKRYFDKKPEKKFGDRKFGEKKFGDRDKRFGDKKPERRFDRKDSGEKRFPHPEAKPVSGAPAPQKAFPHPEAKPVAASEDRPRFARPTVRPAGPAPHEHNRKPAPAKRPVERQENPRQTALNILQDVSRGGAYASLALGERLRGSKLSQRDRDFVSALVYGVLEKRITLDWLIDGKLVREGDLESLVRDMLRLGLYQILYMTRVPDSAAVDETVKLAHAMRREAQAGFINAILRGFAREKESIVWPDRESELFRELCTSNVSPGRTPSARACCAIFTIHSSIVFPLPCVVCKKYHIICTGEPEQIMRHSMFYTAFFNLPSDFLLLPASGMQPCPRASWAVRSGIRYRRAWRIWRSACGTRPSALPSPRRSAPRRA